MTWALMYVLVAAALLVSGYWWGHSDGQARGYIEGRADARLAEVSPPRLLPMSEAEEGGGSGERLSRWY